MNSIRKILFVVLTLVLMCVSMPVIRVYAEEANGSGESLNGSSNFLLGGPSARKQAFLVYIVDGNGGLVSDVIELTINGCDTPPVNGIYDFEKSYFGNQAPSRLMSGADWLPPYTVSGSGNGTLIKNYMLGRNTNGNSNAMTVIENYFGHDVATNFAGSDQYLIIEGVYWFVMQNGTNAGYNLVATAKGWAEAQSIYGCGDYGFSRTSRYTNNLYANCMKFAYNQFGVNPCPSGKQTNSTIMSSASGLISIWGMEATNSAGAIRVIKNYKEKLPSGEYKDNGCVQTSISTTNFTINDESGYKVVGWKTSDSTVSSLDSLSWNPPGNIKQQGEGSGKNLTLSPATEKTIYILYEKTDVSTNRVQGDYTLGESQLTRRVSLSTSDKGQSILSGHTFTWNYGSLDNCGGHSHDNGHNSTCRPNCRIDHGSYTSHCDFSFSDSSLSLGIRNIKENDYPRVLSVATFGSRTSGNRDENRGSMDSGSIDESDFNYEVVLHRGADKVTLAEFRNNISSLTGLADFSVGNTKSSNRKGSDYIEDISLEFGDDSSDLSTSSDGDEGCENSDSASFSENYNVDLKIGYNVYSGSTTGGKVNYDVQTGNMDFSAGNKLRTGSMVESGLEFTYLPIVTMRYDSLDSTDNLVDILGEYQRGMSLNDYAEVEWTNSNKANLSVESSQWSVHNQPLKDLGDRESESDLAKVLPGGAMLSLHITKNDRQKVVATTYQCILIDDGRKQVELTSGNSLTGYDKESALANHKDYVESVVNGLKGISITQWQNKDYNKSPFDGIQVDRGSDLSSLGVVKQASSDKKYYFEATEGAENSSLLDAKVDSTSTVYYTFSSDKCGNILMNGSVILNKNQGVESLTGIAKSINDRTLVVEKLIDSIERNSGDDPGNTWTDAKWYNEQMLGVTVAISKSTISTGFINPVERSCVSDPNLNTKSSGQNNLFKEYMVCGMRTSTYSENYGADGVIGEFKGIEVKLKDMNSLYTSKRWYVSNITTQDLN